MAENQKETQKQPKQANPKSNGGAPQKVKLSNAALRAAQKERKLQRKVERAHRPDTMLIGRMALETNVLGTLVDRNDYLIRSFRDRVGVVSNIPLESFTEIINEQNILRVRLHTQNKKLAALLEVDYQAPGGYDEAFESKLLEENPPGSMKPKQQTKVANA
ncbi:hypothetical protein FY034_17280 (plasmid) [Trichlorobacter lovleyi]|uniref:hypothetical protein n=1 Tax=Trichlorobacter lovleyi TaxID=313985 RepID=UPI00223F8A3A|nr:hypothetical protein [Trichlorobacter lovleyi]QOX80776.1 hypothetical protein FY034_17280 [Trichlorobacter lovleyi]